MHIEDANSIFSVSAPIRTTDGVTICDTLLCLSSALFRIVVVKDDFSLAKLEADPYAYSVTFRHFSLMKNVRQH